MDRRPKPPIWNGDDYASDEDEKPRHRFSDTDDQPRDAEMK